MRAQRRELEKLRRRLGDISYVLMGIQHECRGSDRAAASLAAARKRVQEAAYAVQDAARALREEGER